MLINYLKISWKVLQRRKFFTFVSLFGISFSLMVVVVLIAIIDHLTGAHAPEKNRDRSLYIHSVKFLNSKKGNQNYGMGSLNFFNKYVKKMETPEMISFTSFPTAYNLFVNNKKIETFLKFTDANFWQVMNFNFIEGVPYSSKAYDNSDRVAVISEEVKRQYFGENTQAVGQTIEVEQQKLRVVGVVENVPITRIFSAGGVYVPFSISKTYQNQEGYLGNEMAILQGKSVEDFDKMKAEYDNIVKKIPLLNPQEYDQLQSEADTYADGFLKSFTNGTITIQFIYNLLIIFLLLFLLLPIVNLVNLNISRTLERASEIGVRKAFGASTKHLLGQFIVENIFITMLGGIISIFLAQMLIWVINKMNVIAHIDIKINIAVLFWALLINLFFGILSGVYPAYKMSRMPLVSALKGGVS
jgi:putative ABC transport system permease protein